MIGTGVLVIDRASLDVFSRAIGRSLTERELDYLEWAIRQAGERGKLAAAEMAQSLSLQLMPPDPPIPTYGPGLGEPGRIASERRVARRRARNKVAAASRRRNRS